MDFLHFHWKNFLVIIYWRLSSQLPYARCACLVQTVHRLPCNKKTNCQEIEIHIFFSSPTELFFLFAASWYASSTESHTRSSLLTQANTIELTLQLLHLPILVTKLSPNDYSIYSLQLRGRVYIIATFKSPKWLDKLKHRHVCRFIFFFLLPFIKAIRTR